MTFEEYISTVNQYERWQIAIIKPVLAVIWATGAPEEDITAIRNELTDREIKFAELSVSQTVHFVIDAYDLQRERPNTALSIYVDGWLVHIVVNRPLSQAQDVDFLIPLRVFLMNHHVDGDNFEKAKQWITEGKNKRKVIHPIGVFFGRELRVRKQ
jgi:hypothetical protein